MARDDGTDTDWGAALRRARDTGLQIGYRPRYEAHAVAGEGLFVIGADEHHVLEGNVFLDLDPLLRRGIAEAEAADALEPAHPRALVHYAFNILAERGLIAARHATGDPAAAAFWDRLDVAPAAVARLATARLGLLSVGDFAPETALAACAAAGLAAELDADPGAVDLALVFTDDLMAPELPDLFARLRAAGTAALLVRPTGPEILIGPLFVPGGACYECLKWRLRLNAPIAEFVRRAEGPASRVSRTRARTGLGDRLAADLAAMEAAKWLCGAPAGLAGIRAIDLRDWHSRTHPLTRRPQCPGCGDPLLQADLMSRPVTLDPEAVPGPTQLDAFLRFVDPLTGVVTRLDRPQTGSDEVHSYTAIFGFGRDARNMQELKNGMLSQASGVGRSADTAKIGAICEAIERYSGMYQGDEPAITAPHAAFDPDTALHPNRCMLYSDSQYRRRAEINARGAAFDLVPKPFDETAETDWTGVWSLTGQRFRLLPSSYLFFGYPQAPGGPWCWADSNGCAAGRTRADAIRRGLCELIERDAVALWWYNRLSRPRVDLDSFRNADFDRQRQIYRDLGRDLWVLDVSNDLGVPTVVAVSPLRDRPGDILLAFGADPDAGAAIDHALNEMNHILPAVLPENRTPGGDYPYPEPAQKAWWRSSSLEDQPYLRPAEALPARTAADFGAAPEPGEVEAVARLSARIEALGHEVLVLDQTRPDVGVPVVKVIVPGLRHFWSRFAPGRLYDVPVQLGWLAAPRTEDALNPISMFL